MKELQESSDNEILRGIVAERRSELNPYAPLSLRLKAIYDKLDKEIEAAVLTTRNNPKP